MSVSVRSKSKSETQSFHVYCEELEWRSGDGLRRAIEELVRSKKICGARVIAHLAEIGKRKLHVQWGYQHLFDYCQRGLGLSEGAIALRIQVANVCRKLPDILGSIAEGPVGAALLATVGAGAFEDVDAACDALVQLRDPLVPGEARLDYDKPYARYRGLYPALRVSFRELGS